VLQLTGDKNKSMGVFVSAVHQFCGLAFRKSKSWMILKVRSWETHEKMLPASIFGAIQLLDLPKVNKENNKKLETNISVMCTFSLQGGPRYWLGARYK
jgi:hypothetical protein